MDKTNNSGFAMSYAKGKGAARVYVAFAVGALFAAFWFLNSSEIALLFAVLAFGASFYFYPLVEAQRTRAGAGEHGVFIEGFGLIPWRSIDDIRLSTYAIRSIQVNELHIKLSKSLPQALAADWRSLPLHRLLMKLPWKMGSDNIIRINLEPFAGEPQEIKRAFERNWSYFGR